MEIPMVDDLPKYRKPIFPLPEHWGKQMNFLVFGTKWNCREIEILVSAILTAIARKGIWIGVSLAEVAKVLQDNRNVFVPHDSDWFKYLVRMAKTRDIVLVKYDNIVYIFPTYTLKRTILKSKAARSMPVKDGQG